MTKKKTPPPAYRPASHQPPPKLDEHTCWAFYEHFKSELEMIEPFYNSPPSHENPNNPESLEGKYIKEIYNTAKEMMDEIENPSTRRGVNIHTLINRVANLGMDYGLLSYARYIRGLLGRPDYTLKSALVEAAYYSEWGKENRPKIEQEELEKFKKLEEALEAKRQAGRDSHGLSEDERNQRNKYFQSVINKLCLEDGIGYIEASEQLADEVADTHMRLSAGRIRKNTINPLTQ